MPIARVLPAVARHFERPADAAARQHDRFRLKDPKPPTLTVIPEGSHHAVPVHQELNDRALHVHVDPLVDAVVLQGPDHLEPGPVPHVGQPWILMAAKIPLQDTTVGRPIEYGPPGLELSHPIRRLLCVQLRHPPAIEVLPPSHGVGKVRRPPIAIINVGQRGRHAAFGHDRVGLAQQRLAHEPYRHSGRRGFNRRTETSSAGANDEHIVLKRLMVHHTLLITCLQQPAQRMRRSVQMPMEHNRT